ncbi:MAG TPA: phosphatase PAP2 family protein [Thermoanaerobaculia bacterium]|nr:phosphatase PAP2 family protein [Thermoanaerobaculia bacterium]
MLRRLYFFELFALANLALIAIVARGTLAIVGSPLHHIYVFSMTLAMEALLGVAVRAAVSLVRRDRAYLRIIRTRDWILDTLRLVVSGGVVITTYGWIKLVLPIVHPRLFDEELWQFDQLLFFGMSPTVFFTNLFDTGPFLRVIDQSYAWVFYFGAIVAFGYFLSEPSRRVRVAFANGNAVLWIAGAWLYMLFPSIGPGYRFPDVWLAHAESLKTTQTMQALLMRNFQNVLRAATGQRVTEPIRIVFGIAAFPSLHVGFQTYVFLWMRKLWKSGEVLFGIFVVTMFLGSMITGWHYLIDGLAGMALAYLCYRPFWRRARLDRFLERRAA